MTLYSAKCQSSGVVLASLRCGVGKSVLLPKECNSQLTIILPVLQRTLKKSPRAIDLDLGDELYRVTCSGKGKSPRINIREYFVNASGKRLPTKGLSVPINEVTALLEKVASPEKEVESFDEEYQHLKESVGRYLKDMHATTVKMDCLGCLTNEPNQACHVGGCIKLDLNGHVQPIDVGDIKGVIAATDPATLAQSLNLEPDQADQIYVDFWSHPEDLL